MYEFDNSYFNSVLKRLCTVEIITEIDKYIKVNTSGALSVCFPTNKNQQRTIYFIIHGDQNITLHRLANILAVIKHNINFDDTLDHSYVMIINKEMMKEGVYLNDFEDYTEYSPSNLAKIEQFFTKHFSFNSSPIKNVEKSASLKRKLTIDSMWERDKRTPEEKNEEKIESNDISLQERAMIEDIVKRVECLSPAARELLLERLEKYKKQQSVPNNPLAKTT